MSRNKEKAQSALNRYQAQVAREHGALESDPSLRPKYVQSVDNIPQAEKWRQTVATEISVRLTKINDPTLPEVEIRELNETLNRLHREKRAWEYHIKALGGNDYIAFGNQAQGLNVKGTRYYGRARDLAEVKQMLASKQDVDQKEQKHHHHASLGYYGVFDADEWVAPINTDVVGVMAELNTALGEQILDAPLNEKKSSQLPTSDDVERWLVAEKKKELLAQLGL